MKKSLREQDITLTRRKLLRTAALVLPALALLPPRGLFASTGRKQRSLSFYHTHTGEQLAVTYCQQGRYLPNALQKIDLFLRDFRTEEVHPIDPKLLDILFSLQCNTGSDGIFEVISGYRSPATNAMLRKRSKGVARRSLHTKGKAIDIRLRDVNCHILRERAIALKTGGVGYYRTADFVHLDTGRVRTW